MNVLAAARFFECCDTNQVPPPTLPAAGVSPLHDNGRPGSIVPAVEFNDLLFWNSAPEYHTGPGSIKTLPVYFLMKSAPKTLSCEMEPDLIKVSSSVAIWTDFGSAAFALNPVVPVTVFM